jgi:hypothetical protein
MTLAAGAQPQEQLAAVDPEAVLNERLDKAEKKPSRSVPNWSGRSGMRSMRRVRYLLFQTTNLNPANATLVTRASAVF